LLAAARAGDAAGLKALEAAAPPIATPPYPPLSSITPANAAAVALPAAAGIGVAGSLLRSPDFAALLRAAGADPSLATEAWVEAGVRWAAWKLAAHARALPPLRHRSLTAPVLMDTLRWRYEKEHGGEAGLAARRPHLARVLEQDEAPGVPAVLRVATVLLPGAPPPPGAPPAAGVASVPSGSPGCGLELTDGWYFVWARGDASLGGLAASGRLVAGAKLLTAGATLVTPSGVGGPEPAIVAARTAVLDLYFNGTAPAPAHARLGRWRGGGEGASPRLLPLHRAAPDGGAIARTAFLVRRVYPPVFWSQDTRGEKATRTPAAAAAVAAAAEAAAEAASEGIASALRSEEATHAASLLRSAATAMRPDGGGDDDCGLPAGALAYAHQVATAVAGLDGGGGGGPVQAALALSAVASAAPPPPINTPSAAAALAKYAATRERAQAGRASVLHAAALEAAGIGVPERERLLLRALVSPAVPDASLPPDAASRVAALDTEYLLSLWSPPEGAPRLVEGRVYVATALLPKPCPPCAVLPGARPGLSNSRGSAWAAWPDARPPLASAPHPRVRATLADLGRLAHGSDFDVGGAGGPAASPTTPTATVVGVSAVLTGDREWEAAQWLFVADGTAVADHDAGAPPAPPPWLLAVRLVSQPGALPFLTSPAARAAAVGAAVSFRDLRLADPDRGARLWRADARDTASVCIVEGASEDGRRAVDAFGGRVRALLGE
jgi:hypothetical protein